MKSRAFPCFSNLTHIVVTRLADSVFSELYINKVRKAVLTSKLCPVRRPAEALHFRTMNFERHGNPLSTTHQHHDATATALSSSLAQQASWWCLFWTSQHPNSWPTHIRNYRICIWFPNTSTLLPNFPSMLYGRHKKIRRAAWLYFLKVKTPW